MTSGARRPCLTWATKRARSALAKPTLLHDMTLVNRVSDRVIALNYGRVLAMGSPSEVQRHPDVVAAYLGA